MDGLEQIQLSKRQIKNEETKRKLLNAMEQIMKKYSYNTVTIRNICKVSGVAYGSFYNLFESKEEFLRYYLTSDFVQYMEDYYKRHTEFKKMNGLEKSIDIFVCCAKYNIEKGIRFISSFYSPENYTLFPDINEPDKEYSFTPLVRLGREYLNKAKTEGQLKADADVEKTVNTFCYLFNGITFNWCVSQGKLDMIGMTEKVLKEYIQVINV